MSRDIHTQSLCGPEDPPNHIVPCLTVEIAQVATISAQQQPYVEDLISLSMEKVGKEGGQESTTRLRSQRVRSLTMRSSEKKISFPYDKLPLCVTISHSLLGLRLTRLPLPKSRCKPPDPSATRHHRGK